MKPRIVNPPRCAPMYTKWDKRTGQAIVEIKTDRWEFGAQDAHDICDILNGDAISPAHSRAIAQVQEARGHMALLLEALANQRNTGEWSAWRQDIMANAEAWLDATAPEEATRGNL